MRLKNYIIIAVLIYGGVAGVRLGTPYIRNKIFSHEMGIQAHLMNYGTVIRARNRLLDSAREYKVPVNGDNLVVVKDEERGLIRVEAKYSMTVTVPFGLYSYTWYFHPVVLKKIPPKPQRSF